MKRRSLHLAAASAALLATIALGNGNGLRAIVGNVLLQDSTPGEAQIGHANIKGTLRAGQVNVTSVNSTIPVIGNNNATDIAGLGASFSAAGKDGIAVRGTVTNLNGTGKGVYGESRSGEGNGVEGFASLGTGVKGGSNGSSGVGVLAVADGPGAVALVARSVQGKAAQFFGRTQQMGQSIDGFNSANQLVYRFFPTSVGSQLFAVSTEGNDSAVLEASPGAQQVLLIRNNVARVSATIGTDGIGRIKADVKNFVQPDPENVKRDIVYASIEGPEAAAYVRGTARLINGRTTVSLPEHFKNVVVAQGMTIQLTALDGGSKGLAVTRKSPSGFDVCELWQGVGNYQFDWEVKAVRRGFEAYKVYQAWDQDLPSSIDRTEAMASRIRAAKKVYGIGYSVSPSGP